MDIDAEGGIIEQQHLGLGGEALAYHHLLLVAPRQESHRLVGTAGLDPQAPDLGAHHGVSLGLVQTQPLAEAVVGGHQHVVGHGEIEHQPLAAPLLGHHVDAMGDGLFGRADPHRLALDADLAGLDGGQAIDGLEYLGAATAKQARQPHHLARHHLEGDVVQLPVADAVQLQQGHGIGARGRAWPAQAGIPLAAEHGLDQRRHAGVAGVGGEHRMAVPQHGHGIADPHDVAQVVGDVDDGHPPLLEGGYHLEQLVDLVVGQRGGWLVEHQDAGILGQGLGYLDKLLLADAQAPHLAGRIQRHPQHGQQGPGPAYSVPVGDERPRLPATGQEDVVGHRQGRHQAQVLIDHGNPLGLGLFRAGEAAGLAKQQHLAAITAMKTVEQLDQGRLARAVLADDGMHLAPLEAKRHILEHGDAVKPLLDTARLDGVQLHVMTPSL